jgi:flagellar M-ring protein FliF
MNERLLQIRQKLQTMWQKLTFNQKLMLGAGILMLVIALVMVTRAAQPKYVPLFSQLQLDAAGEVTQKLDELKIPFRLEDGGTTILVPEKNRYQTRIDLANQGLPKGVVGFEIFEQTRFGETETNQKVRFMVALQGELTRTIESMSEVEKAAVHIAMPEQSLFSEQEQPVTASVMLKLKPGVKLQEQQVRGLIHFVASGVERLEPKNVTVVDVSGAILSEGLFDETGAGTAKLTGDQSEIRKAFEQDLERSLQTMLERIVGAGKAVVRVSATLDFDQIEINRENWGNKVERTVQTTEEAGQGTGGAAGVPGTTTNIDDTGTYQEVGQQNSEWEKSNTNRAYEIDKETVHQLVAPGSIKKLSVAVVVDGEMEAAAQPAIEEAVNRAAGIDQSRGDQLTVASVPFDRSQEQALQQEMETEARAARLKTYLALGGAALGAILAAVLAFVLTRRRRGQAVDLSLEAEIPGQLAAAPGTEIDLEEQKRIALKEEVEKLVRQSPEDVAQLLKTWLIEDSR